MQGGDVRMELCRCFGFLITLDCVHVGQKGFALACAIFLDGCALLALRLRLDVPLQLSVERAHRLHINGHLVRFCPLLDQRSLAVLYSSFHSTLTFRSLPARFR